MFECARVWVFVFVLVFVVPSFPVPTLWSYFSSIHHPPSLRCSLTVILALSDSPSFPFSFTPSLRLSNPPLPSLKRFSSAELVSTPLAVSLIPLSLSLAASRCLSLPGSR